MSGAEAYVRLSHGEGWTRRRSSSSGVKANELVCYGYERGSAWLEVRGDREVDLRVVIAFLWETIMTIFLIILVSVLLLALFVGVTVAGGRSHDRQNERRDRKSTRLNSSH